MEAPITVPIKIPDYGSRHSVHFIGIAGIHGTHAACGTDYKSYDAGAKGADQISLRGGSDNINPG